MSKGKKKSNNAPPPMNELIGGLDVVVTRETPEQRAQRAWDETRAWQEREVLRKARICKCGHSENEHQPARNPVSVTSLAGATFLFDDGRDAKPQKITTCYNSYKMLPEGVKCDCPAFLLESVKS